MTAIQQQHEDWPEIADLLDEVLDLAPDERPAYLAQKHGHDAALRRRLEHLLTVDEGLGDFLAEPLFSLHQDDPDTGLRLDRYRLARPLGRGGMGTVHLAERDDGEFEKKVAVKLLKRGLDTDEILRRFAAERRILARLTHPNVAQLLDAGTTDDGRPYFMMEYVDGLPIDEYCRAHTLGIRERVELFRSVCAAVDFAHRNLVVHRDLKPANVLVTDDGTVKLLDFGIAKLLGKARLFETLPARQAPMTPQYASPEQVRGEPVSTAADVYALGVLLYELLSGERAHHFESESPQDIARAVCEDVPPLPSTAPSPQPSPRGPSPQPSPKGRGSWRRELRGDLDNIVMTALRKEPERRFSSVEGLSADLGRYLDGLPVLSSPDTFAYRADKFVRRHVRGLAVAAVISVLVVGLSWTAWTSRTRQARIDRLDAEIARETKLAASVTDFLVLFLKDADPSRSEGRTLTVQEAFAAAADHLRTDLEDAPEVRATLLDAVGGVYRDLGLLDGARPVLEEALALRRRFLGGDHPLVAESLHNLAILERHSDEALAEKHMRQAIAIQHRAWPDGHRDLATGLNNLAASLRRQKRFDEAEGILREALALKLRLFHDEHPEVAFTLNTLATTRRQQGHPEEAEALYRRALDIRRQDDPGSKDVATVLNNLGSLLTDMERREEASAVLLEALSLRRRLHPDGHKEVVSTLNNLGYLEIQNERFEAARAYLDEALAMSEGLQGRPQWDVLQKNRERLMKAMGSVETGLDDSPLSLWERGAGG